MEPLAFQIREMLCINGHGHRRPRVLPGHWVFQLPGDTASHVALEKEAVDFQSQQEEHDSGVLLAVG